MKQTAIRGDHIFWLDEDSNNLNIQAYFTQIHDLKAALNQQLFMNLQSLETHMAIYPIATSTANIWINSAKALG